MTNARMTKNCALSEECVIPREACRLRDLGEQLTRHSFPRSLVLRSLGMTAPVVPRPSSFWFRHSSFHEHLPALPPHQHPSREMLPRRRRGVGAHFDEAF